MRAPSSRWASIDQSAHTFGSLIERYLNPLWPWQYCGTCSALELTHAITVYASATRVQCDEFMCVTCTYWKWSRTVIRYLPFHIFFHHHGSEIWSSSLIKQTFKTCLRIIMMVIFRPEAEQEGQLNHCTRCTALSRLLNGRRATSHGRPRGSSGWTLPYAAIVRSFKNMKKCDSFHYLCATTKSSFNNKNKGLQTLKVWC